MATERRLDHISYNENWTNLSIAQKASVSELSRFGFDLAFVRSSQEGRFAFASLDEKYACINEDGEINMNSDQLFRN
ncbi:hypothetical protein [Pseudoalteromonas denitrificans]|uniref:Uncharacterized protein n=1 Tax=Pseudoalteromonas denitrificans DSM 6059 TaxID=1123010 RepID=A0A1I1MCV2_9GAMM|nr:hypothetical protein [Pseudoalteromonas denitrificans]SFC83257.1 hypothetical protein SAMN02745724_02667 [Pseudoalteromonas denitrificans DSM 6059]